MQKLRILWKTVQTKSQFEFHTFYHFYWRKRTTLLLGYRIPFDWWMIKGENEQFFMKIFKSSGRCQDADNAPFLGVVCALSNVMNEQKIIIYCICYGAYVCMKKKWIPSCLKKSKFKTELISSHLKLKAKQKKNHVNLDAKMNASVRIFSVQEKKQKEKKMN